MSFMPSAFSWCSKPVSYFFLGLWPAPFFMDSSARPGCITEPRPTFFKGSVSMTFLTDSSARKHYRAMTYFFKGSVAMTFLTDSSARKHYTFTEPWPTFFKGSVAMTFLTDSSARTPYRATAYLFQVLHGHLNLLQVLLTLGQLCVHLASQLDQQTDKKKKSVCSIVQKWQCSENSYRKSVWKKKKRHPECCPYYARHWSIKRTICLFFLFSQQTTSKWYHKSFCKLSTLH